MPFVTLGDIDIYYEVHEPGPAGDAPWVLHISGTGNDLRISRPDLNPLNEHFRGLHFDQRGLGQTTCGDGPATMSTYADDAAALLDALEIERCHVVGTSFGGMVAQHLAIRHPQRVVRLALLCTSPGGDFPSYPLHTLTDLARAEHAAMMLRIMDRRADPDSEEPIPGLGTFGQRIQAAMRKPLPEAAIPGRQLQLGARKGHDASPFLAQITVPTLIAFGRYDDLAPPINSAELARHIPNARIEGFEAGHMLMLQDPSVMETVVAFLHEHGP